MNIVRLADVDDSTLRSHISDGILRQLLARRGIVSPEDLDSSLRGLLHYNQLQDIHIAADTIADAIMQQQVIMIAGDYDIDGMSGTALGVRCLRAFGVPNERIKFYVPSRYDEGYGLSINAVDEAIKRQVSLIITVDNGIAAFESVDYAVSHNIKVVVTDHHEIQERLPNAIAVVDPKRKDDNFASKNLCGVGVLFYVMTAVRAKLVERQYFQNPQAVPRMSQFLDLVTLGTIGDVMALDSNNRRLVQAGLKQIRALDCCLGLQALMRVLRIEAAKINTKSISFNFCPFFNASTRIKMDENPALLNLLTDDPSLAESSAIKLELCNKRRTDFEKVMIEQALAQLKMVYSSLDLQKQAVIDMAEQNKSISSLSANTTQYMQPSLAYAADLQNPSLNKHVAANGYGNNLVASGYSNNVTNSSYSNNVGVNQQALVEGGESASKESALPENSPLLKDVHGIVLFEPTFLRGLVGLVATRIKERYSRPCVIFGADVGAGKSGMGDMFKAAIEAKAKEQAALEEQKQAQAKASQAGYMAMQAQAGQVQSGQMGSQAQAGQMAMPAGGYNTNQHFSSVGANACNATLANTSDYAAQLQVSTNAKPNYESGYERIVVKNPSLEEVQEEVLMKFSNPDCEEVVVGSARTVDGIDLMQVFNYIKQQEPDIFVNCGGHAMAAGASIRAKHVPRFRELFNEGCAMMKAHAAMDGKALMSDGELPPSHLCLNFARDLEVFGPWGREYEEPKFDGVFQVVSASLFGNNKHIKLKLSTSNELIRVDGIKFRASAEEKELLNRPGTFVRLFYSLNIDRYFQQERLQLLIEAMEILPNPNLTMGV